MDEEKQEPVFHDALFHRKRKKGKWDVVDAPDMPDVPIADTHAHLQMLPDAALALARAGAHNVGFIEAITDVADEGTVLFDNLDGWAREGAAILQDWVQRADAHGNADQAGQDGVGAEAGQDGRGDDVGKVGPSAHLPHVRIACGVHPHNARLYTDEIEEQLISLISDERVSAIGEVGLDYHYDLSPRDVQRDVFRRQIQLAHTLDVPILLHLREAHDDGFRILEEEGFPAAGTLVHCFNLDTAELERWLAHDCFVAFGGPLTFKHSEAVREAATHVPLDRLLTETDAPFMTPEPLRGTTCGPEHVVWTAKVLCEVRGATTDEERAAFLAQIYDNALGLLDRASNTQ